MLPTPIILRIQLWYISSKAEIQSCIGLSAVVLVEPALSAPWRITWASSGIYSPIWIFTHTKLLLINELYINIMLVKLFVDL
jgi:hypothetical protein